MAAVFLKLGLLGFGGPAAHNAMLRREVVDRRRWLNEERFAELFAISNLMPGPSSTELSLMLGRQRAGWPGLVLAAVLFIGPGVTIVLALAWIYVRFGSVPEVGWVLYGVTPVIIGVIADAIVRMARTSLREVVPVVLSVGAVVLYVFDVSEVVLLLGAGAVAAVVAGRSDGERRSTVPMVWLSATMATSAGAFSLWTLFTTFLKIGAVLYGSGYVLFAFLRTDFVERLGWLTERQLADAIAAGQMTPGPLFSTATFVGYLTGGVPGAVLATVAIFLPCFVFVLAAHRALLRVRRSPRAASFLAGTAAAAIALMAVVTFELARVAIVDAITAFMAAASFVLALRFELNAIWLVLGGAVGGVAVKAIGQALA